MTVRQLAAAVDQLQAVDHQLRAQNEDLANVMQAAVAAQVRYHELFQFAPDAWLVTTPEGIIQEANLAAAELLHASVDQLVGKSLKNFVQTGEGGTIQDRIQQLSSDPQTHTLANWRLSLQRQDGSSAPVEVSLQSATLPGESTHGLRWRIRDISHRERAAQMIRVSEQRFRTVVDCVGSIVITVDHAGTITQWNAAAQQALGWSSEEACGSDFLSLCIAAEHRPEVAERISAAINQFHSQQFEMCLRSRGGSEHSLICSAAPLPSVDRAVPECTLCALDLNDRKEVEHHRVLIAELEHRVKNSMTAIMSIAHHTLADATSLSEFHRTFNGRMTALARMHSLLSQDRMQGTDLRLLLEAVVRPQVGGEWDRLVLVGPLVYLSGRTAQCLGMALHEMATNAVKYGSLSVPTGRVEVHWRVHTELSPHQLWVLWTESGGPHVLPPQRRGFGSRLIEDCVAHDLHGRARAVFDPQGIRCEFHVPLDDVAEVQSSIRDSAAMQGSPAARGMASPPAMTDPAPERPTSLAGMRVLLVEDTMLVSVEVQSMLQAIGCQDITTANTLEQSMDLCRKHRFDMILLDVQLHGEDVWPLVDELRARGERFILITGYACPESLPAAYRDVRFLEKPFDESTLAAKILEAL